MIWCWLIELLFDSISYISILVYNKVSLYNDIGIKKAHLHAKSGSLQGCPETKYERDKIERPGW